MLPIKEFNAEIKNLIKCLEKDFSLEGSPFLYYKRYKNVSRKSINIKMIFYINIEKTFKTKPTKSMLIAAKESLSKRLQSYVLNSSFYTISGCDGVKVSIYNSEFSYFTQMHIFLEYANNPKLEGALI